MLYLLLDLSILTPSWGVIILRFKPILECHESFVTSCTDIEGIFLWHALLQPCLWFLKTAAFLSVSESQGLWTLQYSSAKPVPCIDPLFSDPPSFQLLLKMKNYSRGNSFLPKQPPSEKFIPANLSYMGKDPIKAACQVSYSSYFPGIPRPLLIYTAPAVIKIPCVYLSANQTSGAQLSIHNCVSTGMPGWWALCEHLHSHY